MVKPAFRLRCLITMGIKRVAELSIRERTFGRVTVRRFDGEANQSYAATRMGEEHLCFICGGSLSEQRQGRGRDFWRSADSLRYSPPDDPHEVQFGSAGLQCLMVIGGRTTKCRNAGVRVVVGHQIRESGWRIAAEMAEPSTISPLVVEEAAGELFAAIHNSRYGRERRAPAWLARTRDAVCSHEAGRPPALHALAELADVHPVHLARAFKAHFGYTIGQCARKARMATACRRLSNTNEPIAQVAAEAGFADQSHLTKECRRLLGLTPGQIRAR